MPAKPTTAQAYSPDHLARVRAACLNVATRFGDLVQDTVVVGGLVPALLVDQEPRPSSSERHPGTLDLDLGLSLALLDRGRYKALTERLRRAGFEPDRTEDGRVTRQRWKDVAGDGITVDFLIPPDARNSRGGSLLDIESDFAAVVTPGLSLAFQDNRLVRIEGPTGRGERASREVRVCGAGAFTVLKALAFRDRGENKDAYDIYYVLRNFGTGVEAVADALRPLLVDDDARRAVDILREDFASSDSTGPRRAATFLSAEPSEAVTADVAGYVRRLLHEISNR